MMAASTPLSLVTSVHTKRSVLLASLAIPDRALVVGDDFRCRVGSRASTGAFSFVNEWATLASVMLHTPIYLHAFIVRKAFFRIFH